MQQLYWQLKAALIQNNNNGRTNGGSCVLEMLFFTFTDPNDL